MKRLCREGCIQDAGETEHQAGEDCGHPGRHPRGRHQQGRSAGL